MAATTVFAIESSCDETAAAILQGRGGLLSSVIASQADIHGRFGGVVPEVASRNHLMNLQPVVQQALNIADIPLAKIDVIAATRGPGLASSLLVGLSFAKALAAALGRPFYGINHLEGHLLSPFFSTPQGAHRCIQILVSGGHTALVELHSPRSFRVLGTTRDDAAGEAFDKVARLLGLGYPGGPAIQQLASTGDPARFELPRSMLTSDNYDFSFSGLKTAVRYLLPKIKTSDLPDLCAAFQEAVCDVLVCKAMRAVRELRHDTLAASGGVSINARLRQKLAEATKTAGIRLLLADPALCTDNAAMIAAVALERHLASEPEDPALDADPSLGLPNPAP